MNHSTGVFTIFDSKANAHIDPFCSPTIETAKRRCRLAVNSSGPFAEFPEDYTLFYCGEFDHIKGEHNLLPSKNSIINLLLLVDQGAEAIRPVEPELTQHPPIQVQTLPITKDTTPNA